MTGDFDTNIEEILATGPNLHPDLTAPEHSTIGVADRTAKNNVTDDNV